MGTRIILPLLAGRSRSLGLASGQIQRHRDPRVYAARGLRMIAQTAWLQREFRFDQPAGVFPLTLERLRGTPARAQELVAGLSENVLATRINHKWSVKEHLGHLVDLEPLDDRRLSEFLNGAEVLSAADVENRVTETRGHRNVPIATIIGRLRVGRQDLVRRLETLTEDQLARAALHPRLRKPMRLLDWAYFLAEHDDHHLALARAVITGSTVKEFSGGNR